jgi:hypothetical protein
MRRLWMLVLLSVLMGADAGKVKPELVRRFRLQLHVPDQGGIYFSAWDGNDVIRASDASDGKVVVYRRRYHWMDHCNWVATETLTPINARKYKYTYRETPVSCAAGATASTNATTPRDGTVTVHPISDNKPLTPLDAWSRGHEPPN